MSVGYSKTPLAKKLGIKPGSRIKLVNAPVHYFDLFTDMPGDTEIVAAPRQKADLIHFFSTEVKELNRLLPSLKKQILENGCIWVSWPKKSAKVDTNLNENLVRDAGLKCGLVDIKVCAVDEVWSGLKFVIPVKDRKQD